MGRMLRELQSDPDSGLLSFEQHGGRTTLMVQYWRSTEDLLQYAKDRERQHGPAWREWIQRWAEARWASGTRPTSSEPGGYECVHHHMPPFGLGRVGPLVPAEGELKTASKRLGAKEKRAPLAA